MSNPVKRRLKNFMKRVNVRAFHFGQRLGFDVLPRHFYSEVPAIARLRETRHWREPYSMIGVEGADTDAQIRFVEQVIREMPDSANRMGTIFSHACQTNGAVGYGPVEAQFLYAFVATHRPEKIIQVGSGVSTAVCLAAAADVGCATKFICIDPFPTAYLRKAQDEGLIELIESPVELIDTERLVDLPRNGLLFFDSTHTLGPAGEVSRLILEVLPRVPEDVWIHFHDIWFPYDYAPTILDGSLFFWHESPLLHAFLVGNRRFRIAASLSMLHHSEQAKLKAILQDYRPCTNSHGLTIRSGDYPSSILLRAAE